MVAKRLCEDSGVGGDTGFFFVVFFFMEAKQRQGKHEDVGLAEDTLFDRKKKSLIA